MRKVLWLVQLPLYVKVGGSSATVSDDANQIPEKSEACETLTTLTLHTDKSPYAEVSGNKNKTYERLSSGISAVFSFITKKKDLFQKTKQEETAVN